MTLFRDASICFLLTALWLPAMAQAPVADFTAPASVCRGELFSITNQSQFGESYEWDFCEADLASAPSFNSMGVVPGLVAILDIKVISDGASWRAFVCDGDGNKVYRLDFGASLNNTPTVSAVATINTPTGIDVVRLGNNWYGLVGTFNLPSHLFILDFGTSLTNNPATIEVNLGVNDLQQSRSVRLVQEGNDYLALIANWGQSRITRVNFGSSISATPQSVDLIDVFGASNMLGITTGEDATGKYALVTVYSDHQLLKFAFGSSWLNAPVRTTVNAGTISNPTMVQIEFEANNYYAMLMMNSGQLVRLNFGSDLSSDTPLVDDLGSFSDMISVRGMHMVRSAGSFTMLTTSFVSGKLYRVDFVGGNCGASLQNSSLPSPPLLSYANTGSFPITLRVKGDGILTDATSRTINVTATAAPELTMTIENRQCLGQPNEFSISSNETITAEDWTFGDSQSSQSANPAHTYGTPGMYNVMVVATAASGCNNIRQSTITVFNQPDFDLPAADPLCANQEYEFINTTGYHVSFAPQWEWKIDDAIESDDENLTYLFQSAISHQVELVATNAECTSSIVRSINNLAEGPSTDFTFSDGCSGGTVQFTNLTSGGVSSYLWDFGDGTQSNDENPGKLFSNAGSYTVTLTASNIAGCDNFKTKTVTIFTTPQASFSLDLPPFSCAGTSSQFHDATPSMPDSNISGWAWTFGDNTSGTGKNPSHVYSSPGPYNVGLTVTTDRGCQDSTTDEVTISSSPTASITNNAACVFEQTQFQGSSGGAAKSWQWTVGSSTYTVQNPVHTFATPGEYVVQMTVTANNNCRGVATKNVVVPVAPALDFTVTNPCNGQETFLTATAAGTSDPAVSYQWTFAGGATQSGQNATRVFPLPGVQAVTIASVHLSGCAYDISKDFTVNPTPVATFAPAVQYGPAPLTVTFTNKSIGATTYEWLFDSGEMVTENSPTHTFHELGVYEVSLEATSAMGCAANASGSVHVIVPSTDLAIEALAFSTDAQGQTRAALTIANNSNYPITSFDLVMETGSGVLVTEKVNEQLEPFTELTVATQNALTFFPGASGYVCIAVRLPADQNPENDRQCQSISEEPVVFEPYPNPSKGTLMIQFIATTEDVLDIQLVSETGADAYSMRVVVVPGLNLFNLDVSNLSPGLYVARAISSASVISRRVVIGN